MWSCRAKAVAHTRGDAQCGEDDFGLGHKLELESEPLHVCVCHLTLCQAVKCECQSVTAITCLGKLGRGADHVGYPGGGGGGDYGHWFSQERDLNVQQVVQRKVCSRHKCEKKLCPQSQNKSKREKYSSLVLKKLVC